MDIVKNHKKRHIFSIILGVVLIAGAGFVIWLLFFNKGDIFVKKSNLTNQTTVSVNTKKQGTVHMVAMGDMMAHDTIIENAKSANSYDFGKYFKNIRPSYTDADIVFCDQEGLSSGDQYVISGYPAFNAPLKYSADLQSGAGCNMINLANNHMGDKGVNATNATIDNWKSLKPLLLAGANKSAEDQNKVSYATINGVKISFLAFADFNNNADTPGYSVNNYHDEASLRNLMTQARANSDAVIVSMHWGVEDSPVISDEQRNQAQLLSDLGADVIIGTGPHVLQPVRVVDRADGGRTVIWYSLGNMLSSQLSIQELVGGIAEFDIVKGNNGKITVGELSFTPTYMHYEWTADQAASSNYLARKNAMIYLLSESADPLSKSLFSTTVEEQKMYVVNTLGAGVTVK